MKGDIGDYVRTYPVCQEVKSDNRTKANLLQPMEIFMPKWAQVDTDLVTDLPESNGFTVIVVFVDCMTKMVHFAPCTKEVTVPEYARIFVNTVFRLHGLPEVVISDRDPRFTNKFWTSLFDLLGTDLRFSIAFHPQIDGQSERMIQTLENFLRPYFERKPLEWTQHLALAKFAANSAVSMATGYSSFYLDGSEHPIIPSTFFGMSGTSQVVAVQKMVDRVKAALESAKSNLTVAQIRIRNMRTGHGG